MFAIIVILFANCLYWERVELKPGNHHKILQLIWRFSPYLKSTFQSKVRKVYASVDWQYGINEFFLSLSFCKPGQSWSSFWIFQALKCHSYCNRTAGIVSYFLPKISKLSSSGSKSVFFSTVWHFKKIFHTFGESNIPNPI